MKDYERSETWPYLQTNKLACQSFIYAGRKHQTPGSEADDHLLFIAKEQQAECQMTPAHTIGYITGMEP